MTPKKDPEYKGREPRLPWYSSSFTVFAVAVAVAGVSFYVLQSSSWSSDSHAPTLLPTSNSTSQSQPVGVSSPLSEPTTNHVPECCCSSEDMQATNIQTVHPLLHRVVATPWFAHFAIDLDTECPLWSDSPLCILRDCSVCSCEEPPLWAVPPPTCADDDEDDNDYFQEERVVTTVDDHVLDTWQTTSPLPGLSFLMDESVASEESKQPPPDTTVVVDLRRNPERYTGYSGESASKVWTAIHQENAFSSSSPHLSPAQRIYNRVLSGMHTSISLHIAHSYCHVLDPHRAGECQTWGPHAALAHERVTPDRWDNLHVAFAVVLRAVQTAGPAITAAVPEQDTYYADSVAEWTDHLLPAMMSLAETCPVAFDAAELTLAPQEDAQEIRRRLGQLQQIMQCVGCDRCKLWGTLQALGVETALTILMQEEVPALSRSQAVALVHTLERFSSALVYAQELLT